MATVYKILGQVSPSSIALTTAYTVPVGKQAIVSSILFVAGDNAPNSNKSLTVYAVKSGATATDGVNKIYHLYQSVGSYDNYQFTDRITLAAGESIVISQDTSGETSATFTVFGTEMN